MGKEESLSTWICLAMRGPLRLQELESNSGAGFGLLQTGTSLMVPMGDDDDDDVLGEPG